MEKHFSKAFYTFLGVLVALRFDSRNWLGEDEALRPHTAQPNKLVVRSLDHYRSQLRKYTKTRQAHVRIMRVMSHRHQTIRNYCTQEEGKC